MNPSTNKPAPAHPSWCVPNECEFAPETGTEGYHVGPLTRLVLENGTGRVAARLEQLVDEESPHPVRLRVEVVDRVPAAELAERAASASSEIEGVDSSGLTDLSASEARRFATALLELVGQADALNSDGPS